MEKQSFLSNLIGKANYHGFKEEYALVGCPVLCS